MRTLKFSSLLLLLATLCFAQDVPEPHRLSGHFKATSGSVDGENVDLYLSSYTVYEVRIGDRWFRVSRASVDDATLSGPEVSGPSQGLTGSLTGNQATVGKATLTIEIQDVTRYEATLAEGNAKDRFTLDREIDALEALYCSLAPARRT